MSDVIAEADALADGTTATTSAMTLSLRQGRKRDWMEGYMLTVKGTFHDSLDDDWDKLMQLIADNVVDTGIEDLAHQHDHYLRGTPKKSL
jgi:hypothetical protein